MKRIPRRIALGGIAAAVGLAAAPFASGRRRARPNVLFILTDDHAQSAVGAYGNPILKTPHLDRIALEGMRFDLAFVTNSLCLPSRASYLTGQYSHTHGLITNGAESGFADQPALPDARTWPWLLRRAGYHTGIVGKWHIGSPPAGYDHSAVLPIWRSEERRVGERV